MVFTAKNGYVYLKEGAAEYCKQCGLCEKMCPQQIQIREDLKKIVKEYNELFFLEKLFTSKPTKPNIYNNYKYHLEKKNNYEFFVLNFIEIYKKIAQICELKDEKYLMESKVI